MSNSSSIYGKRFRVTLQEGALDLIKQKIERAITFKEFMNSLVGKTRQQIFDAGSYAFLFTGNKYGMTSAFSDEKNPEVLMTRFLQNLGNYLNKKADKIRSGAANTEEFKKKYDYYGEHKDNERKRFELGRKAISLPDGPEKDAARKEFYAFSNDSKYSIARDELTKKEDKMMEDFHNAPIEREDVKNDGSGDYVKLGLMFQRILRMQKGLNEKLDPKKHDAGDYVKDFAKSKAPQFKGKSKKKKREMAIAAYLDAKDESEEGRSILDMQKTPSGVPINNVIKKIQPYIKRIVDMGITDPEHVYQYLKNKLALDIPHHLEGNPYFLKRVREMVAKVQGKKIKSGLTDSPYDPIDENIKVRKNKQGLMGSKTRIHKDKKKELSKKLGRKKIKDEDDNTVGGGALGPAAAAGNTQGDFYATGDFRVPKMLGNVVQKRTPPELVATKVSGKKKRRKSKKKK
tara:strand:+ start:8052 stop:9425 length:1374 start_codon:yes stop_codon:yes gene_type:complete